MPSWLANPSLPSDILAEAVPGNIRRAEHFLAFVRRFIQYLGTRLQATQVGQGNSRFLMMEEGHK